MENTKNEFELTGEKYGIDLSDNGYPWAKVLVNENHALIGMYEDGKIERSLFTIDRDKAKQLVKILDAFAHEWI